MTEVIDIRWARKPKIATSPDYRGWGAFGFPGEGETHIIGPEQAYAQPPNDGWDRNYLSVVIGPGLSAEEAVRLLDEVRAAILANEACPV